MSLFDVLVTEVVLLLWSDSRVLKLMIENLEEPTWFRMKYSRAALETILSRWDKGSSLEKLIDELMMLKTPEEWEQWIQMLEKKGVRVDIWMAQVKGITKISRSEAYSATSGPLALLIGEDNAERIPWQTLFPGYK